MFRAVALVPSPPLLVPELTGRGADESTAVRTATLAAGAALGAVAGRWIALGVHESSVEIPSSARGSFIGYGVDVPVTLSPRTRSEPDSDLPLAALVAGWIRDVAAPHVVVDVRLVGRGTSAEVCAEIGRDLRDVMDRSGESWGLLVLGDGATTLTAKAPGSFDDRAEALQNRIDDALASADLSTLVELDRAVCDAVGIDGVAAWQVLASVLNGDEVRAETRYRGAPFGVGYYVGSWDLVDTETRSA